VLQSGELQLHAVFVQVLVDFFLGHTWLYTWIVLG
jgi:hypothetical protein